jgi:hypothetical protein
MSRIALSANPFANDQYAAPTTSVVMSAMRNAALTNALVPSLSFNDERLAWILDIGTELSPTRKLLKAINLTVLFYNRINEATLAP